MKYFIQRLILSFLMVIGAASPATHAHGAATCDAKAPATAWQQPDIALDVDESTFENLLDKSTGPSWRTRVASSFTSCLKRCASKIKNGASRMATWTSENKRILKPLVPLLVIAATLWTAKYFGLMSAQVVHTPCNRTDSVACIMQKEALYGHK